MQQDSYGAVKNFKRIAYPLSISGCDTLLNSVNIYKIYNNKNKTAQFFVHDSQCISINGFTDHWVIKISRPNSHSRNLHPPTTLRQLHNSGYQCASASSRCLAFRHRTWSTTAVLSSMLVSGGGCVPQRAEHASWRGHTAPLATGRSRMLDPDYGTVFHRTWKTLT